MLQENEGTLSAQDQPTGSDIFVSVEMSRSKWVVGIHTPLADKIGLHMMACGDVEALLALIDRARVKLVASGSNSPAAMICYEAGYEGFWLYCRLVALGIRVVVINPASLLVDRRAKRAKTDRIDARAMVRALMAWARGERQVLSEVRVPTVQQDDARRGLRERQRLVKERTGHGNRITLGFHLVDLPHHQREALQLAHNLTLQARGKGMPVPGHNRIQACRRIRGPGIEVHDPLCLQQTFDPVPMSRSLVHQALTLA